MSRHPFDIVPLLVGALFVAVGLTYVLADVQDVPVHEGVVAVALLGGLGLLAFAATLRSVLRAARRRSGATESVSEGQDLPGTP
ncbi:hypothetical protein CLV35_3511 [Motilibacter peucedani]|uniref:Uncharacterized protein n=1 Tax=Motilibacter peucedani TaxID=598650 RepID=A0A420XL02_9ACTN|nr:hypothetical protein [Motilibacter peucedani]RKS69334.1 hypothetical protein CLV35_3511 [Motilibacter peucedani]